MNMCGPLFRNYSEFRKRQQQSINLAAAHAANPGSGGKSLIRHIRLALGSTTSLPWLEASYLNSQNLTFPTWNVRLIIPTSHLSHCYQDFFFKSQAWIILFNMFSIFLRGKEREVFQLGVSGRKAIWWIKCGSFRDEGRGPRGAAFLASPTWHTLPRSVFLLACIPGTSVAGVMKPVAALTARQLGYRPVGLVVMLRS